MTLTHRARLTGPCVTQRLTSVREDRRQLFSTDLFVKYSEVDLDDSNQGRHNCQHCCPSILSAPTSYHHHHHHQLSLLRTISACAASASIPWHYYPLHYLLLLFIRPPGFQRHFFFFFTLVVVANNYLVSDKMIVYSPPSPHIVCIVSIMLHTMHPGIRPLPISRF